uniref:Uncharacterized protein n=1 Tax=Oryctolagus cuniculus TaxID=9986 RepID=A0A5F9DM19_RABIT
SSELCQFSPPKYNNYGQAWLKPVAWNNVEYAGGPFALFFLAEYTNIIIINALTTILFLGSFHSHTNPEIFTINFAVKTLLLTMSFL